MNVTDEWYIFIGRLLSFAPFRKPMAADTHSDWIIWYRSLCSHLSHPPIGEARTCTIKGRTMAGMLRTNYIIIAQHTVSEKSWSILDLNNWTSCIILVWYIGGLFCIIYLDYIYNRIVVCCVFIAIVLITCDIPLTWRVYACTLMMII